MQNITVLSLFSGAGGLDIGFHSAGFNIIGCVEIDKTCCTTLELNKKTGKYFDKNTVILNQDITIFDPTQFLEKKVDFVIGGPPCQTYSAAGRRIGGAPGLDDERGQLFLHYCKVIEQLQPSGFLFENVRGLLGVNQGNAWKTIVKAFESLGYKLFHQILDAACYGVAQHRERLFLVGIKEDKNFLFPRPLFGPDSQAKTSFITVGEVLADLQDDNEPFHQYDGKYGHLLAAIPEGMNYSFYTAELGHPEPVFAWRSKFSSFLYKIAQDKPVKTIQAQLGKYAGPFHWKNRRLTVAELKRLQSFPDNYDFSGSYNQIAEQIGNSVPPKLAYYLAQAVKQQLFNPKEVQYLELLPENYTQKIDARKRVAAAKTRSVRQKAKTSTLQTSFFDLHEVIVEPSIMVQFAQNINEAVIYKYKNPVQRTVSNMQESVTLKNQKPERWFSVKSSPKYATSNSIEIEIKELAEEKKSLEKWQLLVDFQQALKNNIKKIEVTFWAESASLIYVAWDAIEDVIKKHSAYISIVGLYGHFAEPHPEFNFTIEKLSESRTPFDKLVEFFSNSSNTGQNIHINTLASIANQSNLEVAKLIRQLRDSRYDIRSYNTTSRIPENYYFCAYPFPELSATYQLKKPV